MARNFQTNLILGGDSSRGVRAMRTVQGELDKTAQRSRGLNRQFKRQNQLAGQLNRSFKTLGITLVGAFSVGATVRTFGRLADEGDRIAKTARNIGISAEFLQEFRGAGELAGNTVQDIDDALRRFNRRLGLFVTDGSGPAAKSIEQLGLNVLDAQGKFIGAEAALDQTIDAIAGLPSVAQQAAAASQLFGDDAGPKLVNLLSQGSEGIAELRQQIRDTGSVMSDEATEAAERYADATLILGRQIKGVAVQIFEGLIPGLTGTLEVMAQTEGGTNDLASAGETLAKVFNVVIRALIIVRETALAVGEVILGLGVTVVGTFRQIVAPIEGTIRGLASASKLLVEGEFSAAADAVKGIGQEIATALEDAREQTDRGLGFIGDSLETRVNNVVEGVTSIAAGLDRVAPAAESAGREISETLTPSLEDAVKATEDFDSKIADMSAKLDGPLAVAIREFNKESLELERLLADGEITGRQFVAMLELQEEQFNRTKKELTLGLQATLEEMTFGTLPKFIQQMLGVVEVTNDVADAAERAGALSQIGSNFARAVLNGQGPQDALSSSLTAFGGQELSETIEEAFNSAFENLDFGDGALKNLGAGFALALGQAVEGNVGQAAFTAAGNLVGEKIGSKFGEQLGKFGGAIGSIIGSLIGDLVFGESVPKFQVRGRNATRATDAGTDEILGTAFGVDLEVAFRNLEDATKSQVLRGYSELLTGLSGVIRDSAQRDLVGAAISRFGVSSRSGPDDLEGQFNLLFDDILGTFDTFTQNFVNVAETLEARIQRLADITAIENQLLLGRGFGLAGVASGGGGGGIVDPIGPIGGGGGRGGGRGDLPIIQPQAEQIAAFTATIAGTGDAAAVTNPVLQQTLLLLDDLKIGNESLQETYARNISVTQGLRRAAFLTGQQFAETAEGVVRFGAELVSVFGDDADRFNGILNRVLEAAFTDAELDQQTVDAARQQATDLLTQLGISVSEETFTQGGLRDLIDNFLGTLGPEETAQLLAAGDAIATLIDAQSRLADTATDAADAIDDAADAADEAAAAAQRLAEQQGFLRDVGRQALEVLAPTRLAFAQLTDQLARNDQVAGDLLDTERQFSIVRLSSQIQLQGFIAGLSESIPNLAEQLFGAGEASVEAGQQIARGVGNMRDAWLGAIDQIRDALDSQLTGPNSSLTNRERLTEAERQLAAAAAAARGGDLGAAQQVSQLFNQAIAQGAGFFGTSTDQFAEFEARIRGLTEGVVTGARIPPEQQTAANTAATASSTREIELTALEQLQIGFNLIDQIGLLAELTDKSPAQIGAQFGIPIADLIEILTGEVPDLTGDALASYFNDLVSETNQQLDELARLEDIGQLQLNEQGLTRLGIDSLVEFFTGEAFANKLSQFAGADQEGSGTIGGDASFGGDDTEFGPLAKGGPIPYDGTATLHAGEFVVPRSGALVASDGTLVAEVRKLRTDVQQGNADRRTGIELTVDEQAALKRLLSEQARREQMQGLRQPRPNNRLVRADG